MSSSMEDNSRDLTPPFLVQMFYQTGSFQQPDEFTSSPIPPHVSVYTWPTCTLHELALELAASKPTALPFPAIGTRLVFQLVCPDLRGASTFNNQPRFAVKNLGSVVIGQGGPGTDNADGVSVGGPLKGNKVGEKTLSDARFVVGDHVSCAILPPLADGSVAPASAARREPVGGIRGGRGASRGLFMGRENGFGRGGGGPSNSRGGRGMGRDRGEYSLPVGEWKRGEKLPDANPTRPRRGRW